VYVYNDRDALMDTTLQKAHRPDRLRVDDVEWTFAMEPEELPPGGVSPCWVLKHRKPDKTRRHIEEVPPHAGLVCSGQRPRLARGDHVDLMTRLREAGHEVVGVTLHPAHSARSYSDHGYAHGGDLT
jgi:hypothetical protein